MFRSVLFGASFAALAALGGTTAWSATAPAANPWANVPAAPTSYYQADDYSAKIDAAASKVSDQLEQRKAANQALQNSATGSNGDPMAMAQRMQEMMMKDPQAATRMMQSMTGGSTANPTAPAAEAKALLDREQQLNQQRGQLAKQYHAALDAMVKPLRARFVALAKRADAVATPGEAGYVWPAWADKELDALLGQADSAYVALAAQWFGPTGQFTTSLATYRNFLVNERTPSREHAIDDATRLTLQLKQISPDQYKSTASLEGVQDYLRAADTVYRLRSQQASCIQGACRDWLGVEQRDAK